MSLSIRLYLYFLSSYFQKGPDPLAARVGIFGQTFGLGTEFEYRPGPPGPPGLPGNTGAVGDKVSLFNLNCSIKLIYYYFIITI